MDSVKENIVEFDLNKVLFIIESNELLKNSFTKSHDLVMVKSMIGSKTLPENILQSINQVFDLIILNDDYLLNAYNNLSIDNDNTKPKAKAKRQSKWFGKTKIESLIAENNGVKTELHSAMLALNDIKNAWARVNRFLIKAQRDGTEVDSVKLREIIALAKTFNKHLDSAMYGKK